MAGPVAESQPESVPLPERVEVLAELLRQAERVIEQQAQAREQLDSKTQEIMAIGLAALGGGVALATFVAEKLVGAPVWPVMGALAAAGLLNLVALGLFIAAYIGFADQVELAIGPDLEWVRQKAEDPSWTREETLLNLIIATPQYAAFNRASGEEAARQRRWGILILGLAVIAYAGIGLYAFYDTITGDDWREDSPEGEAEGGSSGASQDHPPQGQEGGAVNGTNRTGAAATAQGRPWPQLHPQIGY